MSRPRCGPPWVVGDDHIVEASAVEASAAGAGQRKIVIDDHDRLGAVNLSDELELVEGVRV